MRLLLDTHVALWAVTGDGRLTPTVRNQLRDPHAEVFLSTVSLWEIAIKHALGRGDMPVDAETAAHEFEKAGFEELGITWKHVCRLGSLPPVHRDPFDRLLIAQALVEPLTLVTHDAMLAAYSETILRV